MVKANKQFFIDYNVQMTENVTISGLATRIFLRDFCKNNIPNINKSSIYRDIKLAYFGGITEVYKPCGYDLFYYDVNSLYPYVALQDMPGLVCNLEIYYDINQDIDTLFGFFYCSIDAPIDNYLGILPVRTPFGLTFPVGKWDGWYFSEELKFAKQNGYKIKVLKGYSFNREANVFKNYVDKVYKIKSNPTNDTQKAVAKSLLNNLLGRFGISLEQDVTKLLTYKQFMIVSNMYAVTSYNRISDDLYVTTYIPKLDPDIIESHNLDFMKILDKYGDKELQPINVTSVVISAAVTAYGRIHISKLKLDILNRGGELYYSDTDSVVTNIELPKHMVSVNELGKVKLEHSIDKGIFIAGKTYMLSTATGKFISKAKTINSVSLTYIDYVNLLKGDSVTTATRTVSEVDWAKGHVIIKDKTGIKVNSNTYISRAKIYDSNQRWIDTRPQYINNFDKSSQKSLVVYKAPVKDFILINYKEINKGIIVNNNNLQWSRIMFIYLVLLLIVPISFIASLLTLEEGENILFSETESIDLANDNQNNNDKGNGSDTLDDNNATEVIVTSYDNNYYTTEVPDWDKDILLYDLPKPEKSLHEVFVEQTGADNVPQADKSLYEGFLQELSRIQETGNKVDKGVQTDGKFVETDNSLNKPPISPNSTESSNSTLVSPTSSTTTTSTTSENTTNKVNNKPSLELKQDIPVNSNDKFSRDTLANLNYEIKRNEENLENLNKIYEGKDQDIKESTSENLIDETRYLLDQKAKHLSSIQNEASNTPLQDTDVDKLSKEIFELKSNVDQLAKRS